MKKAGVFVLAGVLLLGGAAWYVSRFGFTTPTIEMLPSEIKFLWGWTIPLRGGSGEEENTVVYVESVAGITGQGAVGLRNRYTGSVETQETVSVLFDSSKKLDQIFVKEGDKVKKGDPLFSYDLEELQQKLQEADLSLEEMGYALQSKQEQLAELQAAKAKAKPEELASYNIQELSAQNDIRRQEYEIATKQLERAQLEKGLQNAVVSSELDGMIRQINEGQASGGQGGYGYGSDDGSGAFITILKTGDYRIRGTVSEMNVGSLWIGMPVTVRPRADESTVYSGSIVSIDSEPVGTENQDSFYYYGGGESASKYNFYVELGEPMDLMLGQHVLIEPDDGEEEREGLWLPDYYIAEDEEGSFVWKCGSSGRMEKARVTLGEQVEERMEIRIMAGLEVTDFIAFPEESVREGAKAVRPGEEAADPGNGGVPEIGINDGLMF